MNYDLRIKNGQVITEDGLQRVDLSIKDGKIAQIGKTSNSTAFKHFFHFVLVAGRAGSKESKIYNCFLLSDFFFFLPEDYPDGRPEIAELEAVSRMCLLAKATGCSVNMSAGSMERFSTK